MAITHHYTLSRSFVASLKLTEKLLSAEEKNPFLTLSAAARLHRILVVYGEDGTPVCFIQLRICMLLSLQKGQKWLCFCKIPIRIHSKKERTSKNLIAHNLIHNHFVRTIVMLCLEA